MQHSNTHPSSETRNHASHCFFAEVEVVAGVSALILNANARSFAMQLLREVVGNTHFLDGMKLRFQEVRVPFLVLNHVLE
jgi:hypothetical protein